MPSNGSPAFTTSPALTKSLVTRPVKGENTWVDRSSSSAILPSVTWEAEKAAFLAWAVLKPAHCASVGLKLSEDEACGAAGASVLLNRLPSSM